MEGLTIKELTKLLNEEYGKYVINPKVEIRIEKYRPIPFYIDGEVESPGQYIINGHFLWEIIIYLQINQEKK